MSTRTYQVKDVAALTGVSVRTLHHYEAIGLLVPAGRTAAGYRVYREAQLLRLQQILIRRTMGMSLAAIQRSLDDPRFDLRAALMQQRATLEAQVAKSTRMLRAVDAAIEALPQTGEIEMAKQRSAADPALFDGFDPAAHAAETQQRWGQTDAYAESARRTQGYTPADWARYRAEAKSIMTAAADLFALGAAADSPDAARIVERHRQMIDKWFYKCSPAMHAQLADLYEADARFAKNIDAHADGLTPWWAAAIRASGPA